MLFSIPCLLIKLLSIFRLIRYLLYTLQIQLFIETIAFFYQVHQTQSATVNNYIVSPLRSTRPSQQLFTVQPVSYKCQCSLHCRVRRRAASDVHHGTLRRNYRSSCLEYQQCGELLQCYLLTIMSYQTVLHTRSTHYTRFFIKLVWHFLYSMLKNDNCHNLCCSLVMRVELE